MIIYLASPYAAYANPQESVNVQIDAFAILRDLGHEPIAPLLCHYIDQRHPASYERWLQWCLAMVGVSDVVLRLPGDSDGADREVAEARRLGKPVYYSIDELMAPYTWADFRREHLAQFEAMLAALPTKTGYTWADHQAANQAAKDDIAAFVGGTRE